MPDIFGASGQFSIDALGAQNQNALNNAYGSGGFGGTVGQYAPYPMFGGPIDTGNYGQPTAPQPSAFNTGASPYQSYGMGSGSRGGGGYVFNDLAQQGGSSAPASFDQRFAPVYGGGVSQQQQQPAYNPYSPQSYAPQMPSWFGGGGGGGGDQSTFNQRFNSIYDTGSPALDAINRAIGPQSFTGEAPSYMQGGGGGGWSNPADDPNSPGRQEQLRGNPTEYYRWLNQHNQIYGGGGGGGYGGSPISMSPQRELPYWMPGINSPGQYVDPIEAHIPENTGTRDLNIIDPDTAGWMFRNKGGWGTGVDNRDQIAQAIMNQPQVRQGTS